MAAKLKLDKFKSDESLREIRYKVLLSGNVIAFCIAFTDLLTLGSGNDIDIDFDKESDELIDKHRDSMDDLAFEYVPNIGFDEVDIKSQSWFISK